MDVYHRGWYLKDTAVTSVRGPQHAYYYIVVIMVARKMHEQEKKYTWE